MSNEHTVNDYPDQEVPRKEPDDTQLRKPSPEASAERFAKINDYLRGMTEGLSNGA